jgi:hypothetical protein
VTVAQFADRCDVDPIVRELLEERPQECADLVVTLQTLAAIAREPRQNEIVGRDARPRPEVTLFPGLD